jgi:hypothetical protein
MLLEWNSLPEDLQIALSREALYRAAEIIAAQAEAMAGEIEGGSLTDRGGADALHLFAAMVRASDGDALAPRGMAEAVIPWQGLDAPRDDAAAEKKAPSGSTR